MIAYDADKHELLANGKPRRPAVLANEKKLIAALLPIGDVFSAEWQVSAGKGIDDLLTNGGSYLLVDRYVAPLVRPRVPRRCAEPGEVDDGPPLDEVRQRTAEWIARRFESRTYADTVVLIAPPPGTAKTGSGLRALEAATAPATFGVARHTQATELVERADLEHCRCGRPRGTCSEHSLVLHHDEGRNEDNCLRFEVVLAARDNGYGAHVGTAICGNQDTPICGHYWECLYQKQWRRMGSHVAPIEAVILRPTSTVGTDTVVLDDLETGRLISTTRVSAKTLARARQSPGSSEILALLDLLESALKNATAEGTYNASAYQLLEHVARVGGTTLEAVLARTPPSLGLLPTPEADAYRSALPGQLFDLIAILHEEQAWLRQGTSFTSGIRVTAAGIDASRLLAPVAKANGTTALIGRSVLVLSSTPDPILRQWMTRLGPEVTREYSPKVPLSPVVRIVQDTSAFYGKGTVSNNDPSLLIRAPESPSRSLTPRGSPSSPIWRLKNWSLPSCVCRRVRYSISATCAARTSCGPPISCSS